MELTWRLQFAIEEIPKIPSLHRIIASNAWAPGIGGSLANQPNHPRAFRTRIRPETSAHDSARAL
ncbi:hypothetical protein ABTB92_20295, partial [Acinetobacter baumannii]